MMNIAAITALLLLSTPSASAAAQPTEATVLPDGVRAMIEAAVASSEPKAVETVIRLARSCQTKMHQLVRS